MRLVRREVLQRDVALARLGVVEHRVALAEGAAAAVLAGEAHRRPFGEQRGEGERLGVRPVEGAAIAGGRRPLAEDEAFDLVVELEVRAAHR